jgi:hypothetical protein
MEANQLVGALLGLRRRGQWLTLLGGVGWTFAGYTALFLGLVAALGWWGGSNLRALGWVAVGLGTLGLLVIALVLPLVHLSRPEAVALRIGRSFPQLASDVLSASQLAGSRSTGSFAEALVIGHLKSVREMVSSLPSSRIYSARSLIWPSVALAASLMAGASVRSALPGVVETGLASLWSEPKPPSQTAKRVSAKAPVVGDLALTLRYPEYLKREERRLDSISGGVVAPLGTTVVLEGKSLVPGADRGIVNLPGGGQSPLSVGVDEMIRGRFIVSAAGAFSLAVGTRHLLVEGPECKLEVARDQSPLARMLRPTGPVDVTKDGEVNLEFEAEDDQGLDHIDLVLRTGTNLELQKTVMQLSDQVRRFKTEYRWTPESVRIGDETSVQLEIVAYDNDTISGPKPGRTEPLDVRILTPLSRHKSAAKEQNKALDSMIDLLAHRLENPVPGNKRTGEANERFIVIRRETEDLLGRTARLILALNKDPLTSKRVADAFAQIRQDLSNQLLHESRLYGDELADLRKRRGVDRVTVRLLEAAVIRVDDLLIEQQLSLVVHAGGELEGERGELSKLLATFNRTRTESARRAVLDAISRMEDSIRRLEQDVEAIRGKIGDTYVNPSSFVRLDLFGMLGKLKSLLAAGEFSQATLLVKDLETSLGRLMAGLEGGLISFRTERFGEGERFIGELLDRVMTIEAGQLQLRRETTALQRRYQERLVEIMRGRIDPLVKKQLARVDKIRRVIDGFGSLEDENDRMRLVRLRVATQELKLALNQGDLEEARQAAREVLELADELSNDGGGGDLNGIKDLKQTVKKLDEEVAEAYPRPAQLLSTRDRRLTRNFAVKQRLIANQTRKLQSWADNQSNATRFLSHQASDTLRTAAEQMSDAISFLEAQRVRRALGEQSAALDRLARLREDLKTGGEIAPIESRPMVLGGRVELPEPDDYEVPPEFRKDILEAMHGDLPSKYQDAIKKYYETLVQ